MRSNRRSRGVRLCAAVCLRSHSRSLPAARVFLDEGADRVFYGKASIRSQYRIERAVHAESSGGIGVSLACRAIPGTDSFEVLVDGENGSGSGKDAFLWAFHAQRLGCLRAAAARHTQ